MKSLVLVLTLIVITAAGCQDSRQSRDEDPDRYCCRWGDHARP
ncbi:hypothetical protein [Sneathiella chinensis]|nr:hypothetical protein [Sneathiella chinensis]